LLTTMAAVSVLTALVLLTANWGQSNADFIKGDTVGTWSEGEEWCNRKGRHLASIHSDAENELVSDACFSAPYDVAFFCWIGAYLSGDGDWSWADGSVWNYNLWINGSPSSDGETAVIIGGGGSWYDDYSRKVIDGFEVGRIYPVCGDIDEDICSVSISGFYWDYNGVWSVVEGESQGGAPVYSRETYGSTNYLFKLSNPYGNGWDAWVIGYALDGSLGYWAWRWGGNLFDCFDNSYNYCFTWRYWSGEPNYRWAEHRTEPEFTCYSASTDNSASMVSGSGAVWNGTMLDGAHTIPTFDGPSTAAVSPLSGYGVFPEIAAGVAVSVMILVAIAIAVSMSRKRNNVPNTGGAVHIPELSPMDIAVQIEMGKEAVGSAETVTAEIETGNETAVEMEGDGAADVVEDDVAPKPDDVVSVGHEQ